MGFKQPFRTVPIKLGENYRKKLARRRKAEVFRVVLVGAGIGIVLGLIGLTLIQGRSSPIIRGMREVAVAAGFVRARAPQTGDYWIDCDVARKAGTYPIYAGEPGYRAPLDSDLDGKACEPYPQT